MRLSFHPSINLSVYRGGYPYPIMLCNISQKAMGQPVGGVPCQVQPGGIPWPGGYPGWGIPYQVQPGGYPAWGVPWVGVPCQVQPGGYPGWGVPCQIQLGVPCLGGTLARGVPWPEGYPGQGVPWQGGTLLGGTQLGQHREYLLHGGRYASCVHAGGLSCFLYILGMQNNMISLFHLRFYFRVMIANLSPPLNVINGYYLSLMLLNILTTR